MRDGSLEANASKGRFRLNQMARRLMAGPELDQRRLDGSACLESEWTTGSEMAAGGRVCRVRRLADHLYGELVPLRLFHGWRA